MKSDDLHSIMDANVAEKYPESSFQNCFGTNKARLPLYKSSKGIHWYLAMVKWCLYLRYPVADLGGVRGVHLFCS